MVCGKRQGEPGARLDARNGCRSRGFMVKRKGVFLPKEVTRHAINRSFYHAALRHAQQAS